MRRVDLMDDPRFSSAAARRLNFGALHQIIQSWIRTFPDMATLDAQFDEAKIAKWRNPLDEGTDQVGVERILGRRPARSARQWWRMQTTGSHRHFSRDELTRSARRPSRVNTTGRCSELGVSEAAAAEAFRARRAGRAPRALEPEVAVQAAEAAGQAA